MKSKNGEVIYYLSGVVDEIDDLEKQLKQPNKHVSINSKGIERINARGLRSWISLFQDLKKQGANVHFVECSPVMVEHAAQYQDFLAGYRPESVYLPFLCDDCGQESSKLFTCEEAQKLFRTEPIAISCPHCKGNAGFDDDIETYRKVVNT